MPLVRKTTLDILTLLSGADGAAPGPGRLTREICADDSSRRVHPGRFRGNLDEALLAEHDGADYIGLGPCVIHPRRMMRVAGVALT